MFHELCLRLCGYLALGLGKPRDFFDQFFKHDPLSTFRSIYYLPRATDVVKSDQLKEGEYKLTTPEHADTGFMTILTTFGMPGL